MIASRPNPTSTAAPATWIVGDGDGGSIMNILETLRASGTIRLDTEEAAALSEALQGVPGEAWLFGSRVDPHRRGGDVDILLMTDQPAFETSQTVATRFFSRCEERIDVVVFDPARLNAEQQEFLQHIKRVRLS